MAADERSGRDDLVGLLMLILFKREARLSARLAAVGVAGRDLMGIREAMLGRTERGLKVDGNILISSMIYISPKKKEKRNPRFGGRELLKYSSPPRLTCSD